MSPVRGGDVHQGSASAVAGIDDTEAITFGIGKYDEVGVHRIGVPRHAGGTEADQPLDLGGLFDSVVNDEVEMGSRMLFGGRIRPLQRHSRSLACGRNEDRESVVRVGEVHGFIPENVRPERRRTIDIMGTHHDGPKPYHDASVTRTGSPTRAHCPAAVLAERQLAHLVNGEGAGAGSAMPSSPWGSAIGLGRKPFHAQ